MLDRSYIGHQFAPRFAEVEKGQLKFFAKATGETNSVYFDEVAAQSAGHPALPAPPTFLFSLEFFAPDPEGIFGLLDIDIGNVLHGEQAFTHFGQIYAGDRITLNSRISDIYDRKAGELEFVVQETVAVNQRGDLVGTAKSVTVVRRR